VREKRAAARSSLEISCSFVQEVKMKKLFIIAAFAFVVSLATSSAFGRGEVRIQVVSQQDQQNREQWQRDRWQKEQYRHNQRHEQSQSYEIWLLMHRQDYDNR
jgi:hypothetical protein